MRKISRFWILFTTLSMLLGTFSPQMAQAANESLSQETLDAIIQEVLSRPEFEEAVWGMVFSLPDTGETVYSLRRDDYFNVASAMKVFTAGTVYATLGPDYRFHTPCTRLAPSKMACFGVTTASHR